MLVLDRSLIKDGKRPETEAAFRRLAAFVEENEPRTLAYQVYFDPDGSAVTVIQWHPDSASAEHHMQVARPLFAAFRDLLVLQEIHVYGEPSEALLGELRSKAKLLGAKTLAVHRGHVGFDRGGFASSA